MIYEEFPSYNLNWQYILVKYLKKGIHSYVKQKREDGRVSRSLVNTSKKIVFAEIEGK